MQPAYIPLTFKTQVTGHEKEKVLRQKAPTKYTTSTTMTEKQKLVSVRSSSGKSHSHNHPHISPDCPPSSISPDLCNGFERWRDNDPNSPPPSSFLEGDEIEARYNGKTKYYPGRIVGVAVKKQATDRGPGPGITRRASTRTLHSTLDPQVAYLDQGSSPFMHFLTHLPTPNELRQTLFCSPTDLNPRWRVECGRESRRGSTGRRPKHISSDGTRTRAGL